MLQNLNSILYRTGSLICLKIVSLSSTITISFILNEIATKIKKETKQFCCCSSIHRKNDYFEAHRTMGITIEPCILGDTFNTLYFLFLPIGLHF